MVEHVFRIHTDRSSKVFPDPEPLGEGHVDTPGSRIFQSVQPDIASRSRRRILKDDLPAFGIRHCLQRAQALDVSGDCRALWIPDVLERTRVEVAAIDLSRRARKETPPDFTGRFEVEGLHLIRNSAAID